MSKGHLPRVIYHQVHRYTKIKAADLAVVRSRSARGSGGNLSNTLLQRHFLLHIFNFQFIYYCHHFKMCCFAMLRVKFAMLASTWLRQAPAIPHPNQFLTLPRQSAKRGASFVQRLWRRTWLLEIATLQRESTFGDPVQDSGAAPSRAGSCNAKYRRCFVMMLPACNLLSML